jgi:uncharacterized protein (TIGR00297 family)
LPSFFREHSSLDRLVWIGADTIGIVWAAIIIGLSMSAAVSLLAVRLGALTVDGAVASTAVGTAVFIAGGLRSSFVLLLFFATSSALSRGTSAAKYERMGVAAKSGRRDAVQVLANGGVPTAFAVIALIHASFPWQLPFAGAIAAATADTWATEIGARSNSLPINIATWQRVSVGTSGGVTVLGMVASGAGAALIAIASAAAFDLDFSSSMAVALGGVSGSLIDSILGATVQEMRYCPRCRTLTEQATHTLCGSTTRHTRGWQRFNNDTVNAIASACGSIAAFGLHEFLHRV